MRPEHPQDHWQIRMLYDGLCPFCTREANFLKRRNRCNAIDFEDIAAADFDPAKYGLTMQQVIGAIHGVKRDGTIIRGVDVFVEVYRLCGLSWLATLLSFRPTRPLVDFGYRLFAKYRPRFSKFDSNTCSDRCAMR